MLAFQPFLQCFASLDYEEKEFVECFLEVTRIIDIFTHCKLQPHHLVLVSIR